MVLLPELRITRMVAEQGEDECQPRMSRTSKNVTMFFLPAFFPTYCLLTSVGHVSLGLLRKWGYVFLMYELRNDNGHLNDSPACRNHEGSER